MAIQITQITNPQQVKNRSVNQSMRADTLRCRVGNAIAAKQAHAGSDNNSALSLAPVKTVALTVTPVNTKGKSKGC